MPLGWQAKWFSILCSVPGNFLNPCPCQKSLPNCRAHFEDFEKAPAAKPGHKKFLKTFGVLGDTFPVAGRMVLDPLGHAWGFFEAPPCQKLFAISFASLGETVGRLREPLRKILARRFSKNFFLELCWEVFFRRALQNSLRVGIWFCLPRAREKKFKI